MHRARIPLVWLATLVALTASVLFAVVLPQSSASAATVPAGAPGYWLAASDGGVYAYGTTNFGSMRGHPLNRPVVGMAATPNGLGYWLVASDGGIFAFGQAPFYGSAGDIRLNQPIVGMAVDPATGGYWLVAADGGVFSYHAPFFGSTGNIRLNRPIVGMAPTPTGKGYWLVASDGGVFSFGDARFYGSTGNVHLFQPVVGMASNVNGDGYWLVARDGGIFTFGHTHFFGSAGDVRLARPIVSMAATPDGQGYWIVASDGGIFTYGDAPYLGSTGADPGPSPIVAMAATGRGYPFPPGATGYDVSRYSCGHLPRPGLVNVVQITGGLINAANPCYRTEAAWAGRFMTPYIFLNAMPSPAPPEALSGPAGSCRTLGCESYNYGWHWARYWVAYSRGLGINPTLWWLDVELGYWSSNVAANAEVISGAVAGLRSAGVLPGLYSTYYQWPRIAGALAYPGLPLWVPGAGTLADGISYCTNPSKVFAHGTITLVQYGYPQKSPYFDPDYACR